MDYFICTDFGTQSVRSSFIDAKGNIVDLEKVELEAFYIRGENWAEQDVDYFWEQMCMSIRNLITRNPSILAYLKGIGIGCQRNTVVNVDKNGHPLRPAISWLDKRQANEENFFSFPLKQVTKVIGLWDMALKSYKSCKWNWIRQNEPEIAEKTHKYLMLSGYINYRLSGEYKDSHANMVGYVPYDYKNQKWLDTKDLKYKVLPVPLDKLPELVKPTELLGFITKKASQETGLPEGLSIISAASDKASEILGLGIQSENIACLSLGTKACVNTHREEYKEVVKNFPLYTSGIKDKYHTELDLERGFWLVSWFKDEFTRYETAEAKTSKIPVEKILDEFLKKIPAGSDGLFFQPYFSPAPWDKTQGPECRGSIIGLNDGHTRAHIYKAMVEGLIFALKEAFDLINKNNPVPIATVRVGGGASQSDQIMQIMADIFGLPCSRIHTNEASSLGVAINVAIGSGVYEDYPTAIEQMVRVQTPFAPDFNRHKLYTKLHQEIYKDIYARVKPLYKTMLRIR